MSDRTRVAAPFRALPFSSWGIIDSTVFSSLKLSSPLKGALPYQSGTHHEIS